MLVQTEQQERYVVGGNFERMGFALSDYVPQFIKDIDPNILGVVFFVCATMFGIGLYSGAFTGNLTSENAIIFGFVAILLVTVGGYMYHVSTLLDERDSKKKKKKPSKKDRTHWSIGD